MDTSGVVLTSVANGHFSTSNDAKRRVEGHHKGYFLSEKAKESEADGIRGLLVHESPDVVSFYGPSSGLTKFRGWLEDLQVRVHDRKRDVGDWTISIGTGSQDLMYKVCLLNPGDPILLETPLYAGVLPPLRNLGAEMIEVDVDEQGLSAINLERILVNWPAMKKRPKVVYSCPTGCNPSGCSASKERKLEVLEVCRKYGLLMFEGESRSGVFIVYKASGFCEIANAHLDFADDPYYFLVQQLIPSYFELETQIFPEAGHVLRFDSFSKLLSGGLRLGYATGPKEILHAIDVATSGANLHASSVAQAVAYRLLTHWGLDGFLEHARHVADFYASRRTIFEAITCSHLEGLAQWVSPVAGMFLWIDLSPAGVRDSYDLIRKESLANGVLAVPGVAFGEGHRNRDEQTGRGDSGSAKDNRVGPVNQFSTGQTHIISPATPTGPFRPASTTSALSPKTIPPPDQTNILSQSAGQSSLVNAYTPKDDLLSREAGLRKRKCAAIGYGADEVDVIERTATSLHLALLQDQQITLFPPPPTAFSSIADVVDRLLPYHIWQIHDEELEGEKKGTKREMRESQDAEKLIKRIQGVEERFAKVRRRDGHRPSDLPSLISLVQSSTAALRDEISMIQQSLRSARTRYDTSEAVRRAREKARAEESLRLAKSSATTAPSSAVTHTSNTPTRASVTTSSPAIPSFNGKGSTSIEVTSPSTKPSTTSQSPASTSAKLDAVNKLLLTAYLVNITAPISAVSEFVARGLMVLQPNADDLKAPVSIIRTSEDQKTVVLSLNVKACNGDQLLDVRKLMQVSEYMKS
ncbi:MAG: hypothetical protein TREMPRED_005618 [Tremellales sp. Tagirdzhanova-0007]|nr:MAG: hypothetical protein TREMPRED_005618 [Tremellales sp. Tagirdzhanova-0007]